MERVFRDPVLYEVVRGETGDPFLHSNRGAYSVEQGKLCRSLPNDVFREPHFFENRDW